MYNFNYSQKFLYILLFLLFVSILYFIYDSKKNITINKLFYSVEEIEPKLNEIFKIKENILNETISVNTTNNEWKEWTEKYLYSNPDGWKIFPFYAFGIWIKDNCKKCPTIYNFIKSIPGLKLATLSKLKGNTKLNLHQGWAFHSNYVIRCHYGLIIPENCFVYVRDDETDREDIKYHHKFEWLIFDDSKFHLAENNSNSDRIVLILDIERPMNIEIGKSDCGDTKELLEIINYFTHSHI
jgi:aspartyl/asparaginyl beta-hydroxylase (cupin superfamily)